jgi:WD40 repeat protein
MSIVSGVPSKKGVQTGKPLRGHGVQRSHIALSYSPSGNRLALVCGDDDQTCAIYDTNTWECVVTGKTDRAKINDIEMKNDTEFVVAGSSILINFTIGGRGFKKRKGQFGNSFQKAERVLTCCVYNGNDVLTGNIRGDMIRWSGTSANNDLKGLHSARLDAITVNANHVLTGGKDCIINILSKTYDRQFQIDISNTPNVVCP